jgi:transposase
MNFKQSDVINQRVERITMDHLVVGVDIAKETHVARAVNFRGIEVGRSVAFSNNGAGFERFSNWISALQQKHKLGPVIVGMEATGHYWFNLADWPRETTYRSGIGKSPYNQTEQGES